MTETVEQFTPEVDLRRMLDILCAGTAAIVFSPVFLIVGIAILFEGGRPILYSQFRLGQNGRPFRIYKFRKFRPDCDLNGFQLTLEEDERMTKMGGILAATKLDELPQLWNVLRGDMALVGPRPESPAFSDCFRDGFEKGETFYSPERETDSRLPKAESRVGPASFASVPVFNGEDLVALLYVDSLDPHFCTTHDLERMAKFSRIVAKAVTETGPVQERAQSQADAWETYLERTPVEDMEREKLLLLLNRNEWNIARVARLMGVTRRTIYLRLQRYNIPRERVPKTRHRAAARA